MRGAPAPPAGEGTKVLATEQFDVTIIGAGPGGYVAAIRGAQLGLKVALVERDKRLGGTCGLRGCIPTKSLLMSAHNYELAQHLGDHGVQVSEVKLAFDAVQKRKDKIVAKNSAGVSYLMKKLDREDEPSHIRTVRGIGYTFEPPRGSA